MGSAQLPDHREDRIARYRLFRRTIEQAGATDFDQVEWRFKSEGEPYPVALLEMSRVDGSKPVPETYLEAVLHRIVERDWQGRFAKAAAERLGCRAWIVLFRHDLSEFWVYNLSESDGWWHTDCEGYRDWITKMR